MARELIGFDQRRAAFGSWLEPPRPALTLMIDLDGSIGADGGPLPDAWLVGLREQYTLVEFGQRYASLDIELTPPGAFSLLGSPLWELADTVVSLEELFGASGRGLADRVRAMSDWDRRFDVVEDFICRRVSEGVAPSPAVSWAWGRLCASHGQMRIEHLAAEIGCSRRHLLAQFREQIGLSPKAVARVLRFHAVRRQIEREPPRWADIALRAGYFDQAHLNRDFRDLAGVTPTEFVARLVPGGGLVGDELSFVQDERSVAA